MDEGLANRLPQPADFLQAPVVIASNTPWQAASSGIPCLSTSSLQGPVITTSLDFSSTAKDRHISTVISVTSSFNTSLLSTRTILRYRRLRMAVAILAMHV